MKLDPEVLTADMIQSIKSILPTADELATVKTFTDPNQLDRASRLVYHLNRVPYFVTRLQCHEIPFSWFGFCNLILTKLRIVQAACDEVGHVTSVLCIKLVTYLPYVCCFCFCNRVNIYRNAAAQISRKHAKRSGHYIIIGQLP